MREQKLRRLIREEVGNILQEQNEIGYRELEDILLMGTAADIFDFALDKEMGVFHLMVENDGREYEIIFEANEDGTLSVKN